MKTEYLTIYKKKTIGSSYQKTFCHLYKKLKAY